MTWVRIDDKATNNAKLLGVGPTAFAIWVAGLCHCNSQHTDGHIADSVVASLYACDEITKAGRRKAVAKLVKDGLWEARESGGYMVHDYAHYQAQAMRARVDAETARRRPKDDLDEKQKVSPEKLVETSNVVHNDNADLDSLSARPDPTRTHLPSVDESNSVAPSAAPPPVVAELVLTSDEPKEPPVRAQLAELEGRYDAELCAEARQGCALTRRNGKLADSVWCKTLQELAAHPVAAVEAAMRTFVERYANGEKDERYLIGIARSNAKNGMRPKPISGRPAQLERVTGSNPEDYAGALPFEQQRQRAMAVAAADQARREALRRDYEQRQAVGHA